MGLFQGKAAQPISDPRSTTTEWCVLSVLMLAYLLPFYWAIPFVDGIRDIQAAISIANGEDFPLTGPVFANKIHLGPVWTYILALPLALKFPAWNIPIFLGLIASTKFIFAHLIGKQLHTSQFALAFPVAMALPGWSGLDFFNTTTPALVPAMGLACVWFSLRYNSSNRLADAAAAALAASLAIHAHPSALLLVLAPMVWIFANATRNRSFSSIAAMSTTGLLPLAPAGWSYFSRGESSVFPNALTVVIPGTGHTLTGWLDAIAGFAIGGPLTTLHVLGGDLSGIVLTFATVALALAGLGGCVYCALVSRTTLAIRLCTLVVSAAIITFGVRTNTPWYFLHPLSVFYAASIAFGWTKIPKALVWACILALILGMAQQFLVVLHLQSGEGRFPTAELLDIRRAQGIRGPQLGTWITINDWPEVARAVCAASSQGLAVHGSLAVVLDDAGGLPLHGSCSAALVQLGGKLPQHLVGVPRALWSQFGHSPITTVGSIGLYEPSASVGASVGQLIANPRIYPLRQPITTPVRTETFELVTPPNSVLVITRDSPSISGFSVDAVSVDGFTVTTLYEDVSVHAYATDQVDSATRWKIVLSTSAPEWVDIVGISQAGQQP